MSKRGRPEGWTKPDKKISKTFRLARDIVEWLEKQSNMTQIIEKLLRKEMKK